MPLGVFTVTNRRPHPTPGRAGPCSQEGWSLLSKGWSLLLTPLGGLGQRLPLWEEERARAEDTARQAPQQGGLAQGGDSQRWVRAVLWKWVTFTQATVPGSPSFLPLSVKTLWEIPICVSLVLGKPTLSREQSPGRQRGPRGPDEHH